MPAKKEKTKKAFDFKKPIMPPQDPTPFAIGKQSKIQPYT